MNNQFIDIKTALKLINYQRSASTLNRLCKRLQRTKHVKQEDKKYYISKEYFLKQFKDLISHEEPMTRNEEPKEQKEQREHDIIDFLKSQLKQKDQEINELLQQHREQNVMIQTLHNKLSIGSGTSSPQNFNTWQRFLHSLGLIQ